MFVVYGCVFDELYEAQKINATATTDELLMYSWGWSIMQAHASRTLEARTHCTPTHVLLRHRSAVQRFVVNEPVLIAMAVLIPLLFASECCANMCTEVSQYM